MGRKDKKGVIELLTCSVVDIIADAHPNIHNSIDKVAVFMRYAGYHYHLILEVC